MPEYSHISSIFSQDPYISVGYFLFLVNCSWDEFSSWTTCTKTCGGGTQVRQRQVKVPAQFGGEACEGGQAEQRVCNEQGCPSTYDIVIRNLEGN